MAKFCGKCGTKLDEATGLCPNCDAAKIEASSVQKKPPEGTEQKQEAVQETEKPLSKREEKKKRKSDKKAAKKAKKKEKWKSLTFGQKVKKLFVKFLLWLTLIVLIAIGVTGVLSYFEIISIKELPPVLEQFGFDIDDNGRDSFQTLSKGFTDIRVTDGNSAILAAQEAMIVLGMDGVADELTILNINSVEGNTYYRLQQNYNGIPLVGKTMIVVADDSGVVLGFSTNAIELENISFDAEISHAEIQSNIKAYLIESGYLQDGNNITVEEVTELNKAYYEDGDKIVPVFILQVFLDDAPLSFITATVDAQTGAVISVNNSIYEEETIVHNSSKTISVNGNYDEDLNEFQLFDPTRGILIYSYENTDSTTNTAKQTFITSENNVFGDTNEEKSLEQDKGIELLLYVSEISDYFNDVMGWDGFSKTYCYYNDGYYSGENALGGTASLASGETVGYLSMGSVTGVDALDTLAHEFTHIVSRKIVSWQSIEAWSEQPDESGAINEGYSDIFGEILESQLNNQEPDWEHGSRIIRDPMSQNYPAAVGDKEYKKFNGNKWGMSVGGGSYTDYSHGYSTIISHCAYLMNNGVNNRYEDIDLYNLSRLWYNTLLVLPSNCTFVVLRENMELTAEILGFNDAQKQCIQAAFDEVGILSQEDGEETYSLSSQLFVLDKNGELYGDCSVNITGYKYRGLFKTGLWKEDYSQEIQISNTNPVELNLPKGDFTIFVTDNVDTTLTAQKSIKARKDGKYSEIIIATDFGTDTVIEVPIRTTSDERDVVLVLDVSGSMSGTPMEETKKASVNFVDTILDEDASIGIVTYDNSASRLSDFSVNQDALISAVSSIWDGGGTNIESGLAEAHSMLKTSNAKKKIIVLMSDGEPNDGKEGDALIAYADEIKNDDIIIYTLGFFESLGSYKSSAQMLMEGIASDGCHYEVANADDLVFFFEDMADQINGQKYIYIRIACPVDVSVTYNGETLTSAEDELTTRTDFGTLTFEENENVTDADEDDRIKVLRLKEGADYDVEIVGTGHGIMDYTIGFMDENGDYSDFRRFEDIKITRRTKIDTVATVSKDSVLNIDEDGDGRYDLKLRADENGYGEEVDDSMMMYVVMGGGALLLLLIVVCVARKRKKKKLKENN